MHVQGVKSYSSVRIHFRLLSSLQSRANLLTVGSERTNYFSSDGETSAHTAGQAITSRLALPIFPTISKASRARTVRRKRQSDRRTARQGKPSPSHGIMKGTERSRAQTMREFARAIGAVWETIQPSISWALACWPRKQPAINGHRRNYRVHRY